MKKAHQAKAMSKQIIEESSNFNIDQFLSKELGTYFELILDYFNKFREPHPRRFLTGQKKCINTRIIIEGLTKIIPKAKKQNLDNISLEVLARCFSFLLHPETPEAIRTPSVQLMLNIMSTINSDQIIRLEEATRNLIPFGRFARSHNERIRFSTNVTDKSKSLINTDLPKGNNQEVINNLIKVYQWVNESYAFDPVSISEYVFKNVISIIYYSIASKCNLQEASYGFDDPIIEDFHTQTLIFLNNCFDMDLDMVTMFSTQPRMKVLLEILALTSNFDTIQNSIFALNISSHILSNQNIVQHSLQLDQELFLQFPYMITKIAQKYIKEKIPDESIVEPVLHFYTSTFDMLFASHDLPQIFEWISKFLISIADDHRLTAFVIYSFFNRLILQKEFNEEPWKFIKNTAGTNDIFCAAICKYAQIMGMLQLPLSVDFSIDETISYCQHFYDKKVEDTFPAPFTFFLKNASGIIDRPHEVAMNVLKSMWEPLASFDQELEGLPIPSLPLVNLSDEEMTELITYFLNPFDSYATETDPDVRRRVFAPLLTFHATLARVSELPPGVEGSRTGPFLFSSVRLFKAAMTETDEMIVRRSFDVLSELVCRPEMRTRFGGETRTAFLALVAMMCIKRSKDDRIAGLTALSKLNSLGFVGSTAILPIAVSVVEKDPESVNDEILDLLSSFPLFEVEHALPSGIADFVVSKINKSKELFMDGAESLIRGCTSKSVLKSRVADLCLKHGKNLLSFAQALIASEVLQAKPSEETVKRVFDGIVDMINEKSLEAVQLLKSLTMYNHSITKFGSNALKHLCDRLSETVQSIEPGADLTWAAEVLEVTSTYFIYNYKLMKGSESYSKFAEKITNLANDKDADELQKMALSVTRLLSLYFGAYPFHMSALMPTDVDNDRATIDNIFSTRPGNLYELSTVKMTSADLSVVTPAGRFNWSIVPTTQEFYRSGAGTPFDVPMPKGAPHEIPSASEYKPQSDLNKKLGNLVSGFESEIGSSLPCFVFDSDANPDLFDSVDVQSITTEFKRIKTPPPEQLRPTIETTNIRASALASVGLATASHPRFLKSLSCEAQLEVLRKMNHRVQMKAAVLYVGPNNIDPTQIIATQIEQTTPHFREFLNGLGWPVALPYHSNYDGDLDTRSDRTGETSIFYADYNHELMFQVPALFKEDTLDRSQGFRKRFLAEDEVIVVFCDDPGGFDPTSVTQMGNSIIVAVETLPNALYRLRTICLGGRRLNGRREVSLLVRKNVLGPLVRAIVIEALTALNVKGGLHARHPATAIASLVSDAINMSATTGYDYEALQSLMVERVNMSNIQLKEETRSVEDLFFG